MGCIVLFSVAVWYLSFRLLQRTCSGWGNAFIANIQNIQYFLGLDFDKFFKAMSQMIPSLKSDFFFNNGAIFHECKTCYLINLTGFNLNYLTR